MHTPAELRYSKEHQWARAEDDRVRMGITDYAQDALGELVYVELPPIGTEATANEGFTEVESSKSVSDIYAPVSGRVAEVNDELADHPTRINEEPYGDGWICIIEPSDLGELEGLLDADAYRALAGD